MLSGERLGASSVDAIGPWTCSSAIDPNHFSSCLDAEVFQHTIKVRNNFGLWFMLLWLGLGWTRIVKTRSIAFHVDALPLFWDNADILIAKVLNSHILVHSTNRSLSLLFCLLNLSLFSQCLIDTQFLGMRTGRTSIWKIILRSLADTERAFVELDRTMGFLLTGCIVLKKDVHGWPLLIHTVVGGPLIHRNSGSKVQRTQILVRFESILSCSPISSSWQPLSILFLYF